MCSIIVVSRQQYNERKEIVGILDRDIYLFTLLENLITNRKAVLTKIIQVTKRRTAHTPIIQVSQLHKYLHNITGIASYNQQQASSTPSYSSMMYMRLRYHCSTQFGRIMDQQKRTNQRIQNTKLQRNTCPKRLSLNRNMVTSIRLSSNMVLLLALCRNHLLEGDHHKYLYTHKNDESHQMHQNKSIYMQSDIVKSFTYILLTFNSICSSVA